MNFEKPPEGNDDEKKEEVEDVNDTEHLALTNLIQIELMQNHPNWTDEHADEFRDHVNNHPEVTDQYKQDPEGTIKELEEKFYKG